MTLVPGRGSRRPAVVRWVIALFVVLLVAAPGTAVAVPDPTAGPPRTSPLPLTVTIDSINPAVLTPGASLVVSFTVTNTGDREITDLWTRLQRDARAGSRAALSNVDNGQPGYFGALGPSMTMTDSLEPGASHQFQITVRPEQLAITTNGSYPILINVGGNIDGSEARVGQAAFTMPYATDPLPTVQVAWVLPLIEPPHRRANADLFIDDSLADSIAPDGRLERLLSAAETYGTSASITMLVDPDLVDSLVAMSDGYQVGDDSGSSPGSGQQDAADFLQRLVTIARGVPVHATPYADVDLVALERAGLGSLAAEADETGDQIVAAALGSTPDDSLYWPAGGVITESALATAAGELGSTLLLDGAAFGQEDYLSIANGITGSPRTTVTDGTTQVDALVADPALRRILGDAPQYAAGPVAGVQRFTAELATIAAEDTSTPTSVIAVPPRHWDPSPQLLTGVLALTTSTGWIDPVPLATLLDEPAANRGALDYPVTQGAAEIPAEQLAALQGPLGEMAGLSASFASDDDRGVVFGPAELALFRAASIAHRADPGQVLATTEAATDHLDAVRSGIKIVPPSNGTYTLSSADAPLVFTVENNLPVPVIFDITLDSSRSSGLTLQDSDPQQIAANSRATITLPATVERSGSFSVIARLSTPDGHPLGQDVQIKVSSTAYGAAALIVTGAAFVVLLALIARRGYHRHRFRQQENAAATGLVTPEPAVGVAGRRTVTEQDAAEQDDEPLDPASENRAR